jgi:hypothetical protein
LLAESPLIRDSSNQQNLARSIAELSEGAGQVQRGVPGRSSQSLAKGPERRLLEETSASTEEINAMARKNWTARVPPEFVAQSAESC